MTLFEFTVKCLNSSAFLYLAAAFSFILGISTSGTKQAGLFSKIASLLVYAAFIAHTSGLAGR